MERKEKKGKKKRTRIYTYNIIMYTERIISTGFCVTTAVTYTQKPPPVPVGWPVKQVVALRAPALGGGGGGGGSGDARRVLWRPKRGRRPSDAHGHRL